MVVYYLFKDYIHAIVVARDCFENVYFNGSCFVAREMNNARGYTVVPDSYKLIGAICCLNKTNFELKINTMCKI